MSSFWLILRRCSVQLCLESLSDLILTTPGSNLRPPPPAGRRPLSLAALGFSFTCFRLLLLLPPRSPSKLKSIERRRFSYRNDGWNALGRSELRSEDVSALIEPSLLINEISIKSNGRILINYWSERGRERKDPSPNFGSIAGLVVCPPFKIIHFHISLPRGG